nr:alpha/beta hydrolase [Tissierella sp.]
METYSYKTIKQGEKESNINFNIYRSEQPEKGIVLYFHGGGLIYGSRLDLPALHKEKLLSAGYTILSFDYRLSPESKLDQILSDSEDAVNFFLNNRKELSLSQSPYFLWGRSAGAYLALMLSYREFKEKASGVISFYGYGFMTDDWFKEPSNFYLKYPSIKDTTIENKISTLALTEGDINERFIIYLYARQRGLWLSMLTDETSEGFMERYSLRFKEQNPMPAFFAYSFRDTDVPFKESIELAKGFKSPSTFSNSLDAHDFDRDESSPETIRLLDKMVDFLNFNI